MADEINLLPKELEHTVFSVSLKKTPRTQWYEYESFDYEDAELEIVIAYIGGMHVTTSFKVTSTDAPEQFIGTGDRTINLYVDDSYSDIHVVFPITVHVYERWVAGLYIASGTPTTFNYGEVFHWSDVKIGGRPNIEGSPNIYPITGFTCSVEDGALIEHQDSIVVTYETTIRDDHFTPISKTYTLTYAISIRERLTGISVTDLFFEPYERIKWEEAHYFEVYNDGDVIKPVDYGRWTEYYPQLLISSPTTMVETNTLVAAWAATPYLRWDGYAYGPVNDYLLTDDTHVYNYRDDLQYMSIVKEINAPWVTRGDDINNYNNNTTLKKLTLPSMVRFVNGSFTSSGVTELHLPKCVEITAPFNNSSVNVIDAPNLEEIGDRVFMYTGRKSLNLPKLTSIGTLAFRDVRFDKANFPRLQELGDHVFLDGNIELYYLNVPLLTELPEGTFQNAILSGFEQDYHHNKTYTFPSVETIGDYAFDNANDSAVYRIVLNFPNAISVGDYAFTWYPHQGSSFFYNFLLPKVETIGAHAFEHRFTNSSINTTSIDLPSCKDIGEYAFNECETLTKVTLGNCEAIHNGAFEECKNLVELKVTAPRCQLGNWVFEYEESGAYVSCNPDLVVWVPNRYKNDYKTDSTMGWTYIAGHIRGIGEGIIILDDDTILSIGDYEYSRLDALEQVILNNCKSVGNYGFYNDFLLESLHLPNTETIGDHAFGCSLDEIPSGWRPLFTGILSLPKCKSIGEGAFASYRIGGDGITPNAWATYRFTSLEAPLVEEIKSYAFVGNSFTGIMNLPRLRRVGKHAFRTTAITGLNASQLVAVDRSAFANCSLLTELDLPNLETVDIESFYNCAALTSVSMPKLSSIGRNAFWSCNALVEAVVGTEIDTVCVGNYTPFPTTIQSIWVKDDLVDAYKADRFWSSYASVIKPISERVTE